MDLIRTFLQDVCAYDTILDIGANIGGYTHLFRENCPTATIHAFEPLPAVFSECVKRHQHDQKVYCWHMGVGATVETVTGVAVHEAWTINKPGETRRGRNKTYGGPIFDMRVTTVDAFLIGWPWSGGQVSAIKIDTDGYDLRVLQGAQETIARCRPRILIEFGYCITDLGDKVSDLVPLLARMGYDIYNQHGHPCPYVAVDEWYPWQTTADFLLVPSERALNPRP